MAYMDNEGSVISGECRSIASDVDEALKLSRFSDIDKEPSEHYGTPSYSGISRLASNMSSVDLQRQSSYASHMPGRRVAPMTEVARQTSDIIRTQSMIRKHVSFYLSNTPVGSMTDLCRGCSQHGLHGHGNGNSHTQPFTDHLTAKRPHLYKQHSTESDSYSIGRQQHSRSPLSAKHRCSSHQNLGQNSPRSPKRRRQSRSHQDLQQFFQDSNRLGHGHHSHCSLHHQYGSQHSLHRQHSSQSSLRHMGSPFGSRHDLHSYLGSQQDLQHHSHYDNNDNLSASETSLLRFLYSRCFLTQSYLLDSVKPVASGYHLEKNTVWRWVINKYR